LVDREAEAAIVAGAGTGKTRRIIDLMVRALVDEKIEPTRLLALTFTVKAANEMRDRLAGRLEEDEEHGPLSMIDRMEIGTIHSFASHILRQFPLEAGVSPGFREDEGGAAEALFRERWPMWLRDHVPGFLERVSPKELRAFARVLCGEGMPLEVRPVPDWDARLYKRANDANGLVAKYEGAPTKENGRRVDELRLMAEVFEGRGDRRHAEFLGGPRPKATKKWDGWSDADWERFEELRASRGRRSTRTKR
jgi:hypothetical protein